MHSWVLAALVGLATVCVASGCSANVNGCSIPGNLPYFYKQAFTPACNKHDQCYACGAKWGISRATCDSYFLKNMDRICGGMSLVKRTGCEAVKYDYYLAVRSFGSSHYHSRPEHWCNESWVRSCVN